MSRKNSERVDQESAMCSLCVGNCSQERQHHSLFTRCTGINTSTLTARTLAHSIFSLSPPGKHASQCTATSPTVASNSSSTCCKAGIWLVIQVGNT